MRVPNENQGETVQDVENVESMHKIKNIKGIKHILPIDEDLAKKMKHEVK